VDSLKIIVCIIIANIYYYIRGFYGNENKTPKQNHPTVDSLKIIVCIIIANIYYYIRGFYGDENKTPKQNHRRVCPLWVPAVLESIHDAKIQQ